MSAERLAVILIIVFALPLALLAARQQTRRDDEILSASALNVEAMLWAIRQVETGDDPHAVGRAGERSAYQFMQATWYEHTTAPFRSATSDSRIAHQVARLHLNRIRERLTLRGVSPGPIEIASAWRYGLAGYSEGLGRSDYAYRAAALYADRVRELRRK